MHFSLVCLQLPTSSQPSSLWASVTCEFAINGDARDNQMLLMLFSSNIDSLMIKLPPAARTTFWQANEAIMRRYMFALSGSILAIGTVMLSASG